MSTNKYPDHSSGFSEALFDARMCLASGWVYRFLGLFVILIGSTSGGWIVPALPLIASGLLAIPAGGWLVNISLRQCRDLHQESEER